MDDFFFNRRSQRGQNPFGGFVIPRIRIVLLPYNDDFTQSGFDRRPFKSAANKVTLELGPAALVMSIDELVNAILDKDPSVIACCDRPTCETSQAFKRIRAARHL